MKITLIKEPDDTNEFDIATIKQTFEVENLDILIEQLQDFIHACGFSQNTTLVALREGEEI